MSHQHLLDYIEPLPKEEALKYVQRVLNRCEEMIFHWQALMNSSTFGSAHYMGAYHCHQIDKENIETLKQLMRDIENEGL